MDHRPAHREPRPRTLRFGDFVLEPDEQRLWRRDQLVHLPPKPFDLLCVLVESPGRLLRKPELLERVWPGTFVGDAVLKTTIRQLRAALDDDPGTPWAIDTVARSGYRFIATVVADASEPTESAGAETRSSAAASGLGPEVTAEVVVGRDDDLAVLVERCMRAAAGHRQLLFVTGEAGIGKSTLLDLLARRMTTDGGWQLARGQAYDQHGDGEAFSPFLQALESLRASDPTGDIARRVRGLAGSWIDQLPWLAGAPNDGAPSGHRPEATSRGLDTTGHRERFLREMAELVERLAADSPLLILLEDLHWSDPSTLDLLAFLARRRGPARLAIVATVRDRDRDAQERQLPALVQELTRTGCGQAIALGPLGDRHVEAYLHRRTGSQVVDQIAAQLRARTGGHPLFVRAIVDEWQNRRDRVGDRPIDALLSDLPDELRPMIERQLDGLSPIAIDVLERASFLGEEFSAAAVATLVGSATQETEEILDTLAREGRIVRPAGVTRLPEGGFAGRFAFRHALDRDVLRERVSPVRRARVHAEIARWLELHASEQDVAPAEILHHLARSGALVEPGKVMQFARLAASRALALRAYEEAARHLRVALGAAPAAGRERLDLLLDLFEAQRRSWDTKAAEATARNALELARELGDAQRFARALLQVGSSFQTPGTTDSELVELLESGRAWLADRALGQTAVDADASGLRARLAARLAFAKSFLADSSSERESLLAEATDLLRGVEDPRARMFVDLYAHWARWGPGDIARREAEAARLRDDAARHGEPELEHIARASRITCLFEAGRFADVDGEIQRCLEIYEELQQPWYAWAVSRFVVARDLMAGRFEAAEHGIQEAFTLGQRIRHPGVSHMFGAQMAVLRMAEGRSREVLPMVGGFVGADATPSVWSALAAMLAVTGGAPDQAAAHLDGARALGFSALPRDSAWLTAICLFAETAALLGDREAASDLESRLKGFSDLWVIAPYGIACLGPVTRLLGLLQECLGREAAARKSFSAALSHCERADALSWTVRARFDLGRFLVARAHGSRPDKSDTGRELLQSARDVAADLGMLDIVHRADEFLRA